MKYVLNQNFTHFYSEKIKEIYTANVASKFILDNRLFLESAQFFPPKFQWQVTKSVDEALMKNCGCFDQS